jgi:hypothetical protein
MPEDGYAIRTVPDLFGHDDVNTTWIDTHVPTKGGPAVQGPRDHDGRPTWDLGEPTRGPFVG